MLSREGLQKQLETLVPAVSAAMVQRALQTLMQEGEDVGGGVSGFRLARYLLPELLDNPSLTDTEATWGHPVLKPALVAAIGALPGYEPVEGD